MDAVEYLERIEKLVMMIHNKQVQVDKWRRIAENNTGQAAGERVQASGNKQKMADAVNMYTDIEREIQSLVNERVAIEKVIEQLPCDEYDVLFKHYALGMSLQEIANRKDKSYSWVTMKHSSGVKSVQCILDKQRK